MEPEKNAQQIKWHPYDKQLMPTLGKDCVASTKNKLNVVHERVHLLFHNDLIQQALKDGISAGDLVADPKNVYFGKVLSTTKTKTVIRNHRTGRKKTLKGCTQIFLSQHKFPFQHTNLPFQNTNLPLFENTRW